MSARRAVLAVTVALVSLGIAPAAGADVTRHGHKGDFKPVHRLAGSSASELLAQWWETVLPIPAAQNPLVPGNPELCFDIGRRGKVATYASINENVTCTIKAGQRLFFVTFGVECSSAEPPPFFGETEAEQRACVEGFLADPEIVAIRLSLDGGPPQDVHSERFEVISRQGHVVFPEGAIFEAAPGPATFVAGDWAVTTRHRLRPGTHTIRLEIELTDETLTQVVTFNVLPRHGHDD
jgi:hypothetical protein